MADEPNPEMIREHMTETRADLTEKVETLESELIGTVESVTEQVSETTENVKETVAETVEAVRDTVRDALASVKSTFDIPHQVDAHPWLMFTGAVVAGYAGGWLTSSPEPLADFESALSASEPATPQWASAPNRSSWLHEAAEKFKPEIDQVKGLALGAALSICRDLLSPYVPAEYRQHIAETVDGLTVKLGGKPLHGLMSTELAQEKGNEEMAFAGRRA